MNPTFLDIELLDITILAWLKLIGITFLLSAIFLLIKKVVFTRLSALAEKTDNRVDDIFAELLHGLRYYFFVLVSFYLAVKFFAVETPEIPYLNHFVSIGFVIQFGLSGSGLIKMVVSWYLASNEDQNTKVTAAGALGLAFTFILWVIVFLVMLDNFGIDITALVAGLGIGGIAIALALQNVLSDILAYVSIIADQPFSIGEFLVVGEFSGTVEHIGIKTTRVRSLTGELIIFSNNDLLSSRVRNYKRMNERRSLFTIGVTYDTPHEKLKEIPEILKAAVEAQENIRFDRSHLKTFAAYSINYEVVFYTLVPEYAVMMDIQQAINLQIHREFEEREIEFAFPTQTLVLNKGQGFETVEAAAGS